ncbi:MAG: PHP domain-containing protein [Candidatus Melainabacteria bacterium]|nr:PHP domain-containing protein [Candidatus Melainabacteria bacterium]
MASADLHFHSTFSDGNWSPGEAVLFAIEKGLAAIALTDHDTVRGVSQAIEAANGRLSVIPGVEMSASFEGGSDLHILGYFVDTADRGLLSAIERLTAIRLEHTENLLGMLRSENISISMEDVLGFAGIGTGSRSGESEATIGKAHVTKAIVRAGGAADITEAYNRYLSPESPFYRQRVWLDAAEVIDVIKGAGGVTSLAHPSEKTVDRRAIERLSALGLDALEVYHPLISMERRAELSLLALDLGLLVTGGSDCHGPYEEHAPTLGSIDVPLHLVQELRSAHERLVEKRTAVSS